MPQKRTPREMLLAALERRRLTGYRSSREMAWVVFPPRREGEASLQILHVARTGRFRVVSAETEELSTVPATTLGEFKSGEDAAACVADALAQHAAVQATDCMGAALPVAQVATSAAH